MSSKSLGNFWLLVQVELSGVWFEIAWLRIFLNVVQRIDLRPRQRRYRSSVAHRYGDRKCRLVSSRLWRSLFSPSAWSTVRFANTRHRLKGSTVKATPGGGTRLERLVNICFTFLLTDECKWADPGLTNLTFDEGNIQKISCTQFF